MASGSALLNGSIRKRFQHLDVNDAVGIIFTARKGIKPAVFFSFAISIKMPDKKLGGLLHLHPRTVNNYKDQQKNLDPVQSEHLLKLIALFIRGEEIFGNVDEFNYWLQKPFWNMKEKPIDWLITPGGVDLVIIELDRLAHGYAV